MDILIFTIKTTNFDNYSLQMEKYVKKSTILSTSGLAERIITYPSIFICLIRLYSQIITLIFES